MLLFRDGTDAQFVGVRKALSSVRWFCESFGYTAYRFGRSRCIINRGDAIKAYLLILIPSLGLALICKVT